MQPLQIVHVFRMSAHSARGLPHCAVSARVVIYGVADMTRMTLLGCMCARADTLKKRRRPRPPAERTDRQTGGTAHEPTH